MLRYILKRLAMLVSMLFGVTIVFFSLRNIKRQESQYRCPTTEK